MFTPYGNGAVLGGNQHGDALLHSLNKGARNLLDGAKIAPRLRHFIVDNSAGWNVKNRVLGIGIVKSIRAGRR